MNRKINFKSLFICILIPLVVGGLSALLTMGSMDDFAALDQPPLSPPGWLFPVVWTILYTQKLCSSRNLDSADFL